MEAPVEKRFREYAESYFNMNRKGLFGKKTTVEKILNFKPVCSLAACPAAVPRVRGFRGA